MLNWVLRKRKSYRHVLYLLRTRLQYVVPNVFLKELLKHPGNIGAICPSSRALAERMAMKLPAGKGVVVELGAGTGAITRALLEAGVEPERLVLIEYADTFVQQLRQTYPQLTVIQGNAADLCQILPPGTDVHAIVSSLPLRSLPQTVTASIVSQWRHVLEPTGGTVVQFTYDFGRVRWLEYTGTDFGTVDTVWSNVPPARVFALRYPASSA